MNEARGFPIVLLRAEAETKQQATLVWSFSDSHEGHQVDAVVETKVIAADPGEGELEEIAHRTDLHQRSDREVSIDLVVTTEYQGEHRAIDRSGCESQVAPESPTLFVRASVRCTHNGARGQDSQQTGGTGPS